MIIEPDTVGDTDQEHIISSIAISLKRIADALDKQNEIALCVAQGFPSGDDT